MKEQFVTYEIAVKLKELGFDEECFGAYYDGNFINIMGHWKNSYYTDDKQTTAPLWQQAMGFIHKYGLHIVIDMNDNSEYYWTISRHSDPKIIISTSGDKTYSDFPNARKDSIIEAIEIIKK